MLACSQMLFVSPSVGDMLGQKSTDLEGRDFLDLVFGKYFLFLPVYLANAAPL